MGVAVVIVAVAAVWVTWSMADGPGKSSAGKVEPCRIDELRGPDSHPTFFALAVSASGEHIVGDAEDDVIHWRDGDPEIIDDVSGVRVVNSDGTIAGSGRDGAWRYADGAVSELDEPRGGDVDVNGINDNGDVVATVRDADAESEVADGDPVSSRGYPLLWKAGTDKPVELEVADGKRAHADAVTEDGTVLGYQVDNGTDKPVPWRWNDRGEGERLPRLPGDDDGGPQAVPVDVAGDWVLSTNAPDGYRWKLSAPDKAERLKLDSQSAVAVDSRGLAYGLAEWGVPGRQSGDEVLPLENLTDDSSGGDAGANTLKGASDDGTVLIGSSVDDKGTARAVTWTCG